MKTQKNLLKRQDLAIAAAYFECAAAYSRAHSRIAQRALAQYGDHGAQISGCVRDHFPEHIKEDLTTLAHLVTQENENGRKARPRGVREQTMHALAREVCRRDSTGFYGYSV